MGEGVWPYNRGGSLTQIGQYRLPQPINGLGLVKSIVSRDFRTPLFSLFLLFAKFPIFAIFFD